MLHERIAQRLMFPSSVFMNHIRNVSEDEIRQANNKDPNSNFLYCTYPVYEETKLRGIDKQMSMITVLGDPGAVFSNNGFSDVDEKKPFGSDQKRKKMPNPFSCTVPSFIKKPIKESAYNREDYSHIYCYTPQLCDQAEDANRNQNKPYVHFIQIDEEFFGENFNPTDLVSTNPEKKYLARNAVRAITYMMCKNNGHMILQNLENVTKKLSSDRVFTLCGKKLYCYSESRIILE